MEAYESLLGRKRASVAAETKMREIDWYKIGVLIVIGLGCLSALQALPQNTGIGTDGANSLSPKVSSANMGETLPESGICPEAAKLYWKAVRELHQGLPVSAEKDAARALRMDKTFADAAALEATAELEQRHFERARIDAIRATKIDRSDEKAWVILATAENRLGRYGDAAHALRHVRLQDEGTWQVAYQWARAEAGLQNLQQCLEWSNLASLSAPQDFAPLHLLRASVLRAMGKFSAAADQLEIYLQLPGVSASQRVLLERQLHRLRQQSQKILPLRSLYRD